MVETKKATVFKYTAIFEPDKEVGGYSVSIPALPGCVSQGDTFEEAVANIKEATELYLEVLREKNEEIPLEENSVVAPVEVTL
jgi:predicted RNase H-like HicB family nuclease